MGFFLGPFHEFLFTSVSKDCLFDVDEFSVVLSELREHIAGDPAEPS